MPVYNYFQASLVALADGALPAASVLKVVVGVHSAPAGKRDVLGARDYYALGTNARAKMQGVVDGFVKLYCRPGTGTVLGGVIVAPRASELILPVSVAVENNLTVDQLAQTFTIYPSLSGSVTEAARQLHLAMS